jgi:CRP-like cAMP-binding protein
MLSDLASESLRERALLLRTLPAFAALEDESLSLLGEHVRLRRYRAGARLLTAFEPLHHIYMVLEGRVRCRRPGHDQVSFAQRHDGVGFLSLMAREPDGVDAVVEDDALVLELPAEILEHILELDFAIIRNMLRNCAGALVERRGHLPVPPQRAPVAELGVRPERRRTMVERLIDMRDVPLFRRGNVEALIALTRRTEYVEVEAGHVFWQHGGAAPCWLVIEYGKVHCVNAAGVAVDVGANFVIGTMDAIAQRPRAYSAVAETEVVGNRIELASFMGVLETHFDLAREFAAFLAREVLSGA